MSSSSPTNNGGRRPSGSDKPRLTEAEKKTNHIVSEQKRRQAIRHGFDRLAAIVPGYEGQGRSEAVVLQATVDYLRAQLALKQELKQKALANGIRAEEFEAAYNFAEEGGDVRELQGEGGEGSAKGNGNGNGKIKQEER